MQFWEYIPSGVINIVQQWMDTGKAIAIWGAGKNSQHLMQYWIDAVHVQISCVYDNLREVDFLTWGAAKLPVRRIGSFGKEYRGEKVIVCCIYENDYAQVSIQLSQLGLKENIDYVDGAGSAWRYHNGRVYEKLVSGASYAPWRTNKAFMECYKAIEGHTLVDIYRCWSLWSLVSQAGKCTDGDIVEIGVWRGGTGLILAEAAKYTCPESEVFLCDTFSGVAMAGTRDWWYQGGEHADTSVEIVEQLLQDNHVQNAKVMQGIFPNDFKEFFTGKKIRFAHIDVDVYEGGKSGFHFLLPHMNRGGIIVFDDYGSISTNGITDAVEELAVNVEDAVCITNLNGQAVFIKIR